MKYLKLFEDHEGELFWEIELNSHFTDVWDCFYKKSPSDILKTWVPFTDAEVKSLKDRLPTLNFIDPTKKGSRNYEWDKCRKDELKRISHSHLDSGDGRGNVVITKTVDEWFCVYSSFPYKCDQFDGLLACLEHLKEKGEI